MIVVLLTSNYVQKNHDDWSDSFQDVAFICHILTLFQGSTNYNLYTRNKAKKNLD